MAVNSLICKYTNGYQAHFIDEHPGRDSFRSLDYYLPAYPDETIVILKDGVVVCYVKDIPSLKEIEGNMGLTPAG